MSITSVTHLNFRGQAREALTFYKLVFGGELITISYRQGNVVQSELEADQILWGQVTSENGFQIMAYDVPSSIALDRGVRPFYVSIRGNDESEIKGYWEKLSEGADIIQELASAGWSPLYGMVKDKFGVIWVLDIAPSF
ncbi:VOC family protein [Pseudoalteromonas piscicida]|uniref:VOC family protein n=1 Tax=Pseudoalteromonas piscicida TaxID=43662 RepID=UPI0027E42880|nr:VOC family protein [Pseudoalteromonas piscicida]WMO16118.1 VOC family protein [Pseudoalteromonas piscicida]